MQQITIIGMGLIGASLGLALRTARAPVAPLDRFTITGYDANRAATRTARGRLAIDREATSLVDALHGADVVVVATPVQAVQAVLRESAALLAPGTIVTDVASTKAMVCQWAQELLPSTVSFVGGHPMAGKEQAGAEFADATLFQGAIYCLTPRVATSEHALAIMDGLVTTIGATCYYIDPEEHDAYVAGISHVPFLLSAALMEITGNSPAWREMAPLAASGFRDITRLASGDPIMHRDICMTNRVALMRWLDETVALLTTLRDALSEERQAEIEHFFVHAHMLRDAWLAQRSHTEHAGKDDELQSWWRKRR